MISHLSGTVIDSGDRHIVLDVAGVGYKIYATADTISSLSKTSDKKSLWTYLAVRDDALDLYGFTEREELEFFKLLISVSGIGPKTALGILNTATTAMLRKAIISGETAHLTKMAGMSKKIVDKIVLELKNKVGAEDGAEENFKGEIEALEGLKALGFTHKEARDAIQEVGSPALPANELIREALKILGK